MLPELPPESALGLLTSRLTLEPVREAHASELWTLLSDPELHQYVPFEPQSLKETQARCVRWARRISPTGDELWLNWLAREATSGQVIGHFQAGIKEGGVASVGYLLARAHQGKGHATEALTALFEFLRLKLGVREVKAWVDTRNLASRRLVERLGMSQTEMLSNADFFKGASSDEAVYSKLLNCEDPRIVGN